MGDGGAQGAPNVLRAYVAHSAPGRLRLKIERRQITLEELDPLVDRIAAISGVHRVVGRPNTGSIIIEHAPISPGAPTFADTLSEEGVVSFIAPPTSPPLDQAARFGIARLDADIAERTGGALNLHSAIAVLLLAAAAVQASRGRVVGPATTLLLSALSLLEHSRK